MADITVRVIAAHSSATDFDAADVSLTGAGTHGIIFEDVTFDVSSTPGVFKFQFAQNTSNALAVYVLAGSYLEWEGQV